MTVILHKFCTFKNAMGVSLGWGIPLPVAICLGRGQYTIPRKKVNFRLKTVHSGAFVQVISKTSYYTQSVTVIEYALA